jgi:hypothetical protein
MIDPETIKPSPFREAWAALRKQFDAITEVMDDPFKAPELTLAEIPELMNLLWSFQIEWVVLQRGILSDEYAVEILKEARRNVGLATNEGAATAGRLLDALIVRTERGEDRVV